MGRTKEPTGLLYLGEFLESIGGVPVERVRLRPHPGTAKEKDLLHVLEHENRPCELIAGVLVEKPVATPESVLTGRLVMRLGGFVEQHDLGVVTLPDGLIRLGPGHVRAPDLSFTSWERVGNRERLWDRIYDFAPDLAVEVLSPSNTRGEMIVKLKDYFLAGVRLAWIIDPETRTAAVHTAPDAATTVRESGHLDGGDVLPGFRLALRDLFSVLPPRPRTPRQRRTR